MTVIDIALIIASYLLGSISSAIIVCKILGLPDPRSGGSGNPGATNVLRLGGKKAALVTLAGDFLKGLIPVLVAVAMEVDDTVLALVAAAAFLGHLFPIFFGFKGGKGVATALGVLMGIAWQVGLAVIATWIVVAVITRYSSLSAIIGSVLSPLYMHLLVGSEVLVGMNVILSAILLWRHRGNISRLLRGTESKIGSKKSG
ncbi:MAG: glycerol-3-phosphate 1-O-acyltransferase PlsY [Gammaproteobacteria bacterium]|nr:glycerol-3-phosphate 1-O-acyltransferase PlsY [Gammaproteobacteria bacterium]